MFVFEVLYFTQRRSICIIPVNKSQNAIEYFDTQDAVCKGNRHASKLASGGALAHPHAGWQLAVALTVATACKSLPSYRITTKMSISYSTKTKKMTDDRKWNRKWNRKRKVSNTRAIKTI